MLNKVIIVNDAGEVKPVTKFEVVFYSDSSETSLNRIINGDVISNEIVNEALKVDTLRYLTIRFLSWKDNICFPFVRTLTFGIS